MRKHLGQTLVEVLVAVGVATLALLGLIQVSTKSISNSGFSKRQSVATTYAIEGMEWIKNQRNQVAWSSFYKPSGTYNFTSLPATWVGWGAGGCGGTITGTEYSRCATFLSEVVTPVPSGPSIQQVTITVDVTWNESGRTARSRQQTIFTRY